MTFLFDTSVIIDYLHGDRKISRFIADHQQDSLMTSAICEFEVLSGVFGLANEKQRKETYRIVREAFASFSYLLAFDTNQAEIAARIWADLSRAGRIIGDTDVLIAAAAKSVNATLVTRNTKHFSRVTGLSVLPV